MNRPLRFAAAPQRRRRFGVLAEKSDNTLHVVVIAGVILILWYIASDNFVENFSRYSQSSLSTEPPLSQYNYAVTSPAEDCPTPAGSWSNTCVYGQSSVEGPCSVYGSSKCVVKAFCKDVTETVRQTSFEYPAGTTPVLNNINGVLCNLQDPQACGASQHVSYCDKERNLPLPPPEEPKRTEDEGRDKEKDYYEYGEYEEDFGTKKKIKKKRPRRSDDRDRDRDRDRDWGKDRDRDRDRRPRRRDDEWDEGVHKKRRREDDYDRDRDRSRGRREREDDEWDRRGGASPRRSKGNFRKPGDDYEPARRQDGVRRVRHREDEGGFRMRGDHRQDEEEDEREVEEWEQDRRTGGRQERGRSDYP